MSQYCQVTKQRWHVYCSVLQCVAVCGSVCCSVLQCAAVCSVLQCNEMFFFEEKDVTILSCH